MLKEWLDAANTAQAAEFGIHAESPGARRNVPAFGKLKLMHGLFRVAACGDGCANPLDVAK